jgi:large subunit ribosomal protein L9
MQIILLDKVVNLGNLGEIVKVKDGYARNFLIPSGRARRATEANKAEFEAKRVELEKAAAVKLAEAQAQGEKLAGTTVKLTQKAGVDGRLFGSVTNHDIAEELNKQGYKVVKAQIRLPNGPIKVVSDTSVSVALHTDVVVGSQRVGLRRNRLIVIRDLLQKPPSGGFCFWCAAPIQGHPQPAPWLSTGLPPSRQAALR